MTAPQSTANVKWPEIKVDIIKSWGKLSDSDLEKTKGNFTEISTLLQKNYGESTSSYNSKLSEIFKRFEAKEASKGAEKVPLVETPKTTAAEVTKAPTKSN